ncbi:fructosamine kinase family protein [Streptomyces avicenniae]|uniref:fructosamine kinase family protein n=1 Tax=Streptomyces avicenniae TaxID=500153 RepID=UPI00069CAAA2|nr:fructosamine kinase family protein [Streptomyces avicenniae]
MNTAALASRAGRLLDGTVTAVRPLTGGDISDAHRIDLADGRTVFAKTLADAPPRFFAAEAAGLALLRGTGTVAVPDVLATGGPDDPGIILLEWLEPAAPDRAQAERLGRDLAALHHTPAARYGTDGPLFLGRVPQTGSAAPGDTPGDWAMFHVEHRLLPLLRQAADLGRVAPADARAVERLCNRIGEIAGPPQPPAVIHGDLWSGNVQWSPDGRPRLIDPAAQGGHPETDLALLDLFGCPHLDALLAAYAETRPVPGRAARVPLHQLQHLLVHAVLFGGPYGRESGAAARAALAAA